MNTHTQRTLFMNPRRLGQGHSQFHQGFHECRGVAAGCPGDVSYCSGHTCTRLICSARFDGGFFVFVRVVVVAIVVFVVVVVAFVIAVGLSHKPGA